MKGFTLIELLVVVLIIGILSSVALPQYTRAVKKARLTEAWTTLGAIDKAIQIKKMEEGDSRQFTFDELDISFIDQNGQPATGNYLATKYFGYELIYNWDSTNQGNRIRANTQLPFGSTDEEYMFLTVKDGKRYCSGGNSNETGCKKYAGLSKTSETRYCMSGNTCFTE
ncbi:MAG: type IV pilin protein [Candidatus Avelusimicrobium sp.]|uniref:type IV pilin protein n=1 Tax=Candidatus Avelusimicrobium sp. TaxID=3048833 RepID=UPI003F12A2B2